jgi:hypothetical protein
MATPSSGPPGSVVDQVGQALPVAQLKLTSKMDQITS